jgi:RNA polymerase sigma-70 factor, ECF subfamily
MPIFHNRRELLDRFRNGDSDALEAVYRAYVDSVCKIVRHGCSRPGVSTSVPGAAGANTGDLVQEIFLKAFSRPARLAYDGVRPYGPYLYTIARHALVDWARHFGREVPTAWRTLESALEEQAAGEDPPYADPATMALVEQFLRELPGDLRAVHEKRYTLGLSQHEAANALGMSRQTLRTAETRLRTSLARALARRRLRPVA